MNYFALAAALLAALIALRAFFIIVVTSLGLKRFAHPEWGFTINAAFIAVFAPLALWLLSLAFS